MAKIKSFFNRQLRPTSNLPRTRRTRRQYKGCGGGTALSMDELNAINRIKYVLPPLSSSIPPDGGFNAGGKNYINNTSSNIDIPDPLSEASILAAGFEVSPVINNKIFNQFVSSDVSITIQELVDSDNTYGVSASTSASPVTVTIPDGAALNSEFTFENLDGVNDLTVVVLNQSESIDGDISGIVWSVSGGVTIKKQVSGWVIVSQHTV